MTDTSAIWRAEIHVVSFVIYRSALLCREIAPVCLLSGKETAQVCLLSGKETAPVCLWSGKETAQVCLWSGKETAQVCLLSGKEIPPVCLLSGKETAPVCVLSGKETAPVCLLSGKETAPVLTTSMVLPWRFRALYKLSHHHHQTSDWVAMVFRIAWPWRAAAVGAGGSGGRGDGCPSHHVHQLWVEGGVTGLTGWWGAGE